jgi:regulator of sigma E protease
VLHSLPDVARTVASFAVVLGVLVFFHELGHYLAARWRGVHVEAFSIGFGRAIASGTDRHGTVWKLGWLPLGGYVKLHGQERPQDVPEEVRATWLPGQTFHEKSILSRAIIVAAGPFANFLLAVVLFAGLNLTVGKPFPSPVVGEVVPNSAAARAGLEKGDRIVTIDGNKIATFNDVSALVSTRPGQTLSIVVHRGDSDVTIAATPETKTVDGRTIGQLGISNLTGYEKVGVIEGLRDGVTQTAAVTTQTVRGVWQMITGQRGTEDLGGVIRIAQLSGHVAQLGIVSLITFIAVLSINLGLINLFPVPVLDGGHLLFFAAEALRGRPLPARAQEYSFRAGLAVILSLVVFSAWNDLSRLGVVRWFAGLIG